MARSAAALRRAIRLSQACSASAQPVARCLPARLTLDGLACALAPSLLGFVAPSSTATRARRRYSTQAEAAALPAEEPQASSSRLHSSPAPTVQLTSSGEGRPTFASSAESFAALSDVLKSRQPPDVVWSAYLDAARTGAEIPPHLLHGTLLALVQRGSEFTGVKGGEVPIAAPQWNHTKSLRLVAVLVQVERTIKRAREQLRAARGAEETLGPEVDGHPLVEPYAAILKSEQTRRISISALGRPMRGVQAENVHALLVSLANSSLPASPKDASGWKTREARLERVGPLPTAVLDDLLLLISQSIKPYGIGSNLMDVPREQRERSTTMRFNAKAAAEKPITWPSIQPDWYNVFECIRIFEGLWPERTTTRVTWQALVELECRLACLRWRARYTKHTRRSHIIEAMPYNQQGGLDSWGPVRDAVAGAHKAGQLDVIHINTVLSKALRATAFDDAGELKPDFKDVEAYSKTLQSIHTPPWPSWDKVQEAYAALRSNLLQAELGALNFYTPRKDVEDEATAYAAFDASKVDKFVSAEVEGALHPLLPHLPVSKAESRLASGPLPPHLMPTRETYALLINAASFLGDWNFAISVLQDMCATEVGADGRASRWVKRQAQPGRQAQQRTEEEEEESNHVQPCMKPTILEYMALFKGFARHGLSAYRMQVPSSDGGHATVEWVVQTPTEPRSAQQLRRGAHSWNIHTLLELFEGFLALTPSEAYPRRRPRQRDEARSALVPPVRGMFALITALRRCSGEDAAWVLEQWQRVVDKFGPADGGASQKPGGKDHYDTLRAHGQEYRQPQTNAEGWTGWRLTARLERTIAFVEEEKERQATQDGEVVPVPDSASTEWNDLFEED